MEINPTFIQYGQDHQTFPRVGLALALVSLASRGLRIIWGRRAAFHLPLPAALSFGTLPGLLGGLTSPMPSLTRENTSGTSDRVSSALYERVPPPRSLVRAEDIKQSQHPAFHPSKAARMGGPLFPREPRVNFDPLDPWERGVLDLRRSERRRSRNDVRFDHGRTLSHHVVAAGDTLWDIAAKVLDTSDRRAIARYWPKLHKENVDVIGRDPNVLRPGQVLSLPPKEEA